MNAESILMRDPKLSFFMSFINLRDAKIFMYLQARSSAVPQHSRRQAKLTTRSMLTRSSEQQTTDIPFPVPAVLSA